MADYRGDQTLQESPQIDPFEDAATTMRQPGHREGKADMALLTRLLTSSPEQREVASSGHASVNNDHVQRVRG